MFLNSRRNIVSLYINIALIITSVALIISVVLQNKGIGMGGLTGSDSGGVYTARRGIEKTLFWITIILSAVFFILTVTAVIIEG
jgi:preprotein translocase subunit SecG